MPELPEVESARATIERSALGRVIVAVDDTDTYECRPHPPGEIAEALLGRRLSAAHRQGKSLWCTTSERPADATDDPDGEVGPPVLGLHLGMSGRIVVAGPDGAIDEGGDRPDRRVGDAAEQGEAHPVWNRFSLTFADGGFLRLFDKRRLGRVRLDPDLSALGPDAERIGAAEFASRLRTSATAVKARLLDQSVLSGVGNLLADETLWQARLSPQRPARSLSDDEVARLHRALRAATRAAIRHGGVHTGEVIPHRRRGGECPRCGAAMMRATVGGRTTWWCPGDQL